MICSIESGRGMGGAWGYQNSKLYLIINRREHRSAQGVPKGIVLSCSGTNALSCKVSTHQEAQQNLLPEG